MRAAVTGAAGFVGRAVVADLLGRGDSVVAILRDERQEPAEWRGRVEVFRADLADALPPGAMTDVEVVFHCAAQVRPTWDRHRYVRNNVRGTQTVLEAAFVAGVRRVVHFSSLAVYGEHIDHRGADESTPFANPPPNPYVATKIEAERVVEEFRGRGLDVVVMRPGWVWGPGDSGLGAIARQIRKGRLLVPGPGSNILHLVYVENLARAALLAADREGVRNEAFIVHDDLGLSADNFLRSVAAAVGVDPTIRHVPISLALAGAGLVEAASRAMHRDPIITRYQVAILAHNQGFSIGKARKMLDFRPQVPLEEGLARTVRWITESHPSQGGSQGRSGPRRTPP